MSRLEMRLAKGRLVDELDGEQGDGTSALWARLPDGLDESAAALAILGDYVPFGIGQALGAWAAATASTTPCGSARVVPTEWVLLDVRMHAVRNGFGHGLVHLWAEDGTLLATASQSTIVRHWKRGPGAARDSEQEAGSRALSQPLRWGMTIPFDGPLDAQRERMVELESLGYTDVWSARRTATTPSRRSRSPRCGRRRCGSAPPSCPPTRGARRRWPRASARWPRRRRAASRSASGRRPTSSSSGGTTSRSRSPTRAARHAAVPAGPSPGEKVDERLPSRRLPPEPVPILVAALREGMLRLAGREGDGAIINWLSADDVTTVAPMVREGGGRRRAEPGDLRPHLRGADDRRRHGARDGQVRHRRLPQRARVRRLPRVARTGRPAGRDVGEWAEGDRKAALAAIPDEVVDQLIVRGSPEECHEHLQRYIANGVTTVALAPLPFGFDVGRPSATSPRADATRPALAAAVAPRGRRRSRRRRSCARRPGRRRCARAARRSCSTGTVAAADARRYLVLPVDVAEGTTRVEVAYDWQESAPAPGQSATVLDLGIWDSDGTGAPTASGVVREPAGRTSRARSPCSSSPTTPSAATCRARSRPARGPSTWASATSVRRGHLGGDRHLHRPRRWAGVRARSRRRRPRRQP